MTSRIGLYGIFLLLFSSLGFSQMKVILTNPPSSILTVKLIDVAHPETVPVGLISHTAKLPPGSFQLQNHASVAINAVVVEWKITSKIGTVETQRLQCSGFRSFPREAMVRADDSTLITPHSCAKSELFSQLDRIAFNSPFLNSSSGRLVDQPDNIESIEITVDSVIYEDGGIWGPDKQQYYRRLWQDQIAVKSVVKECSDAAINGEDIRKRANKIKNDLATKLDRVSALQKKYSFMIASSPNPQKALANLQLREELPEFHHMEDSKK